jgi:hypothetical protein
VLIGAVVADGYWSDLTRTVVRAMNDEHAWLPLARHGGQRAETRRSVRTRRSRRKALEARDATFCAPHRTASAFATTKPSSVRGSKGILQPV